VEGLAKAGLARAYGSGRALESERRYAMRTLPSGVVRELAGALRHRDPGAVVRAGAIVFGLAITAAGYLRARASRSGRRNTAGRAR
jgi:hypothetical protein